MKFTPLKVKYERTTVGDEEQIIIHGTQNNCGATYWKEKKRRRRWKRKERAEVEAREEWDEK